MRQTSMQRHIGLAVALALGLAIAVSARANATVLVQDAAPGLSGPVGFYGQSVTTPNGGPFTNITFNFYNYSGGRSGTLVPFAPRDLFIFSQPYLDLAGPINNSNQFTPGFVAKSVSNTGGIYSFSPSVTINANQQYFFYEGGEIGGFITGDDTYAGGNLYYAPLSGLNFTPFQLIDADFSLSGTAAVPEPSSLALILPAIGVMLGLRRWRRLPAQAAMRD